MADDVGSLLLRSGLVAAEQLDAARMAATNNGGTVPEQLVQCGFIDDEELTAFYRSRLLIPRVHPSELAKLSASLLGRVPADMATEFRSIPVSVDEEGNLTLVMSDPSDSKAADEIGFFTGSYVMRAIATQAQIAWCLAHYYKRKTGLYLELVASGHWPDSSAVPDDAAAGAFDDAPLAAPDDLATEKDTMPIAVQKKRPAPSAKRARRAANEDGADAHASTIPQLEAETGPLAIKQQRPRNQQPSPPELFARAGEISTTAKPERAVDVSPAVVISLNSEESAVIIDHDAYHRGGDTAPILLSEVKKRLAEQEAAEALASRALTDEPSGPILLDQSRRTRRTSRRTNAGLGALGKSSRADTPKDGAESRRAFAPTAKIDTDTLASEDVKRPRSDNMVADARWGEPGTTIPPAFLGASASSYDDVAEGIPIAIDEDVTSEIRAHGSTPVPLSHPADKTAPMQAPGPVRHSNMAEASSRLLLALRAIDHAASKQEVIEPLLEFLDGAFERTGFLALRQDELVAWQIHGCADTPGETVHVSLDEQSSFSFVVRMRLPYNGPIEDATTKKLARDIDIPDAFDVLALPLAIRDRVIGVLFGMGSHGKVFEEHLSVLSQAATEALEELLRKRR